MSAVGMDWEWGMELFCQRDYKRVRPSRSLMILWGKQVKLKVK